MYSNRNDYRSFVWVYVITAYLVLDVLTTYIAQQYSLIEINIFVSILIQEDYLYFIILKLIVILVCYELYIRTDSIIIPYSLIVLGLVASCINIIGVLLIW